MSVANNIKEIREKKKLRQIQLADAVMTDTNTISRYERGERCPSLEMALRLSRYLNVSTDLLFSLDNEQTDNKQHI